MLWATAGDDQVSSWQGAPLQPPCVRGRLALVEVHGGPAWSAAHSVMTRVAGQRAELLVSTAD